MRVAAGGTIIGAFEGELWLHSLRLLSLISKRDAGGFI